MAEALLNTFLAFAAVLLGAFLGFERARRAGIRSHSVGAFVQSSISSPEDARIGYEAAVNLWVGEGTQVWSRFTAMIYANTILLATIGVIITSSRAQDLKLLPLPLAVLGLVLCAAWAAVTRRGFAYFKYWILSARELEERYLNPPVRTVMRGAAFGEGEEIEFLTTPRVRHRLDWWGQVKIERLSYLIIALFAMVYIATCWVFLATMG